MKKQLYILTIILTTLFISFIAKAQTSYEDVVYLKNGSIIHGIIIEQIPNQSIKIQTRDGNVFVYKIDEVEKMTKEQAKISKKINANSNNADLKQFGYINITEMNLGLGLGQTNGINFFGFQTINGYLINPNFSIGLGIGADIYPSVIFIPIFADLRINFLKTKVAPFFSTGVGYSMTTDKINNGGLLINPAFGVKFFVTTKTALNFSIGYKFQKNSYKTAYYNYYYSSYSYDIYTANEIYSFLNFKLGMEL